jgi:hypothetical protein
MLKPKLNHVRKVGATAAKKQGKKRTTRTETIAQAISKQCCSGLF